ncbi:sigma-70 family RNA polymerase sigma factor [Catellatospora citrea]|uniref:RNA polymerase sigma factor n=1 Tax=Catellatospora citrea TaxID=53366 RepID=A0A8J3P3R5_9ACTN|nr:sigma-70 family RNA polymerase sigma factor [Catellatospora citrea]RKE10654.1 RNA polymerase sigma-70 factor (ECF subfamily) [Catellatospora citrea]GIG03093.1 RNA polymerase sigma factor SigL [Catellatospora citrea]
MTVLPETKEPSPPWAGADRTTQDDTALAEKRMQDIWVTYADPLLRFLRRLNPGREHVAEDLLQETLLRAWRNLDKLSDNIDEVAPWLYTVARRVAIDSARARQARPVEISLVDADQEPVVADVFDRVVSAQLIREALPRLTPEHRNVLIELYLRQHSTSETALRLSIPEGTVKSRAYYALRALNALLDRVD